ncbi:hypothetical protein NKR23_g10340 [Pleurostoma richardsiae]|uniref:DUF7053 domain-containing protein n=1 Tax=Pleurostoma richardsiae TaxID=41990 RepID=A0AA38VIB4_9PEZI|nr:hypothetical protein NKR23_g10340 [Pleurostoma richardsiae]
MRATHTLTLHFPLPSYLSPDLVLERLHAYEPLITPHPYLVRFRRRPVPLADLVDDPFFTDTGRRLAAYEVTERIVLLPSGLVGGGGSRLAAVCSKDVRVPAVFQSFDTGVRCRADAQGGVRVWSTYEVVRRRPSAEGEEEVVSPGAGDWELVETATLECASWMKGFVAKSLETAHRDICRRMIDEMVRTSGKERWPSPQVSESESHA